MKTIIPSYTKNYLAAAAFILLPVFASAQENEVASVSYFSNALFNTLLVTIILLAILILALSNVLKNLSNSEMLNNLFKKKDEKSTDGNTSGTVLMLLFTLIGLSTFAQEAAPALVKDSSIGGLDQFTFYFMSTIIFLELLVVGVLIHTFKYLLKSPASTTLIKKVNKPKEKTILDKLSGAVELENEESILLDHDYDGIKELDNDLPPWWKYGFYLTILVAIVYLINYHVTKTAPLQAEEYAISMKKAEAEIAEYMKNSANNVDETTVKMLDNPADLAAGKDIFIAACAACHGKYGEGTVGPNLTDDYWLHPGSIQGIFKTIKYGWPDKGMKSWKEDYSPIQIAQLSSYIKTLRGTNPPKPKEKQGDLYLEENTVLADTLQTTTDSLKTRIPADSLK